jgi:hypothetical protein
MSQKYYVDKYKQGDEEQIVSLLIKAFKVWPFFDIECSPIDHWRWKYLDNPDHQSMLLHVKSGDEIVAVGQNILFNVKIKGEQYSAGYGTDACVHPDYQGQGIYGILSKVFIDKEQDEGVHFIYMVTVNPRVINSKSQRVATPHSFPYKIKYMTRIEDLALHARVHETGIKWRLGKIIEKAGSQPIRSTGSDKTLITVNKFDDTISGFLEKMHSYYDFIRVRTVENLNWRYLEPCGGKYLVRAVIEDGVVAGYAVFRINKLQEYHLGYIVELLAPPDRVDNAEALLLDGLNYFQENNVNSVTYQVVEGHPYEKLVSKYGFSGGEANRIILYNNWGYEGKRLDGISPEKFYFSFGDLTGI